MNKNVYTSDSVEFTENLGKTLAKTLKKGDFIAMFGDLGAGKTAFTRGIASELCPNSRIQSPTYTIVNEYRGSKEKIYHFDMYRVDSEETLYSTGFFDYLDNGICIAEWSENILDFIPEKHIAVTIKYIDSNPNSRIITIEDLR